MRAEFIYINPQGVPCAPTKGLPLHEGEFISVGTELVLLKASCIPIREEDRNYMFMQREKWDAYKPDTFYTVEPYEFEVGKFNCECLTGKTGMLCFFPCKNQMQDVARIIRTSEPKPILGPDLGSLGDRDEMTPEKHAQWTENFKAIHNHLIASESGLECFDKPTGGPYDKSEPKANPSKELYSIPRLQWKQGYKFLEVETPFGNYGLVWAFDFSYFTPDNPDGVPCESVEDGMNKCQTHLEYKLKQVLTREV